MLAQCHSYTLVLGRDGKNYREMKSSDAHGMKDDHETLARGKSNEEKQQMVANDWC